MGIIPVMSQTAMYTDIQWQIRTPAVQKDSDLTQRQVTSEERLVSLAIHILRIVCHMHRKIIAVEQLRSKRLRAHHCITTCS